MIRQELTELKKKKKKMVEGGKKKGGGGGGGGGERGWYDPIRKIVFSAREKYLDFYEP